MLISPMYAKWEHNFGNTVDDMIDGLPIITKHSIVKNLYNGMFNKVNSIVICIVLLLGWLGMLHIIARLIPAIW